MMIRTILLNPFTDIPEIRFGISGGPVSMADLFSMVNALSEETFVDVEDRDMHPGRVFRALLEMQRHYRTAIDGNRSDKIILEACFVQLFHRFFKRGNDTWMRQLCEEHPELLAYLVRARGGIDRVCLGITSREDKLWHLVVDCIFSEEKRDRDLGRSRNFSKIRSVLKSRGLLPEDRCMGDEDDDMTRTDIDDLWDDATVRSATSTTHRRRMARPALKRTRVNLARAMDLLARGIPSDPLKTGM